MVNSWYEVVRGSKLMQGDMFFSCPIIIPPSDIPIDQPTPTVIDANLESYDVILLSQSCDLQNGNVNIGLVCPYKTLETFISENKSFNSPKMKEVLKRGNSPGYHLLNKCNIEGFESDYLVVNFRNTFGIHLDFLNSIIQKNENRLRLISPYREQLSQAFGRFFMRVALPDEDDIPSFI